MNKNDKYVIYFGGGTMRGVFGAGVATAFQEANFYPRIDSIYTASAGVMTGAGLLANQMREASPIYWEDLSENFISKTDFYIALWQRFQDRFIKAIPEEKMRDPLHIEVLMDALTKKKPLDLEKIKSQSIPFYVKLFNLNTYKVEYLDARNDDILKILECGVSAFPYVHKVAEINDHRYIEAAIIEIIGIEHLLQKHPDQKIIIVSNGNHKRVARHQLKNMIEGKYMEWIFRDKRMYRLHADAEEKLAKDLEIISSNPRVTLISPPQDRGVKSRTTDPRKLKLLYQDGIDAGQNFLTTIS